MEKVKVGILGLRRGRTEFWDHIGLPEDEPEGETYESGRGVIY